uniref:TAP binding protein n=1 Tax=Chinchilla lanigera TaxID=34839 RepID=A0A8C2VKC8_CHILA
MKPLSLLLALALGEERAASGRAGPGSGGKEAGVRPRVGGPCIPLPPPGLARAASAGPAALECWFVEDLGGGALEKRPAALLLRQGPWAPPPRPDLDPQLYLGVDDPAGALLAALRRLPRGAAAPRCEMSRFVPLPTPATWARRLSPERSCPRALDGAWLMVSVTSPALSLSCLLRSPPEPQPAPALITMATVVLTVLTHTPAPRILLGQDAVLDLSFTYMPPTPEPAATLASGPPPFGLEWRRQHLVRPFQEGTYLATVHLPYLQGQVALQLAVHKPPEVSLTPAPLVWAAPGEAPPELLCLASHFYPPEGLEVEWELQGGPEGGLRRAKGERWVSSLHHHSDGSVSVSGHFRPPPVTAEHHGARYVCRVRHPSLPASGHRAVVTVEVAGLSGPSLEDGVGLFLSAFLVLGLIKVLSGLKTQ